MVGPAIKRVILGGSEFGNQTLTRIYGLHVVVLPLLLILIGWVQARLFGRVGFHGPRQPPDRAVLARARRSGTSWQGSSS